MSRQPATRTMPCRMMIVKNLSYLLQHDPGKEIAPPRHRFKTHSQCQRGPEGRQPDTPAAFRKAKPSRNLFPHSGTAFSSNCVAAIPAQRVTTSRGEPNRLSPNSARRSRGDFRSAPRSEEHTSELQSLMRISYAVFCLK